MKEKNHAYTFLYGHCRLCNDFRSCRSRKVSQDVSLSFSLCIGLKPLSLTTPAMSMTLLRSTLSQPKLLLSQPLSQHLSQPLSKLLSQPLSTTLIFSFVIIYLFTYLLICAFIHLLIHSLLYIYFIFAYLIII